MGWSPWYALRFGPAFCEPSGFKRSRCPRGAKPIFFFSAEKKKMVLDAKRKRVWGALTFGRETNPARGNEELAVPGIRRYGFRSWKCSLHFHQRDGASVVVTVRYRSRPSRAARQVLLPHPPWGRPSRPRWCRHRSDLKHGTTSCRPVAATFTRMRSFRADEQ